MKPFLSKPAATPASTESLHMTISSQIYLFWSLTVHLQGAIDIGILHLASGQSSPKATRYICFIKKSRTHPLYLLNRCGRGMPHSPLPVICGAAGYLGTAFTDWIQRHAFQGGLA
jgi:hypothetical protein